ncbi:MAG: 4Fe-4S binding protein [Gammaproteobacteria bacterium]
MGSHSKFATGAIRRRLWLAVLLVSLFGWSAWASAAGQEDVLKRYPAVASFFPQATRFGPIEGTPPAAAVYRDDKVVGYVFTTKPIEPIPAYSGKPVNLLVGMDLKGHITGTQVLEHHEPILLVGIPESALDKFIDQYKGKSVQERIKVGAGKEKGFTNIDAISGATVTVMVVNQTILRAAREVAVARGLIKESAVALREPATIKTDLFQKADWKQLTGDGSLRRMHLSYAQVEEAFKGTAAEGLGSTEHTEGGCTGAAPGVPCDTFVDLYYGLLNPPTIGRNLLGESQYNWLMSQLNKGDQAVVILGNGEYSFKGSAYVRGGIFDRVQIVQGDNTITFHDLDYFRLADLYTDGTPKFHEMGIFVIRAVRHFDPGAPWSLQLRVRRQTGALTSVFTSFNADYQLPEKYFTPAPTPVAAQADEPIWITVWRDRVFQIVVLSAGLLFLTFVMIFQDWLARFPRLIIYLRNGFLLYTLIVIGWYMLGQLSVVNVLTFTGALMHGFSWDTFLIDPTMFILWAFVAVTLLLWGRGVYCGWLCPFGALQKLVNEAARKLKVPQWRIPTLVHERLWAIKYVILLILFGISLQSLSGAERYAEVEPFKTAITLHFMRELPFVLYAAGLVVVSAFNCKFYCKYVCPLGAALAIPARLRLFDWLKRRKECGKPCQICANECEIQAIADTGEINPNECHYCLDCQVTYWDDHKCPPLIDKRRRREKAQVARVSVRKMEEVLGAESGLDKLRSRDESSEGRPERGRSNQRSENDGQE